jgi:hypothetical protein
VAAWGRWRRERYVTLFCSGRPERRCWGSTQPVANACPRRRKGRPAGLADRSSPPRPPGYEGSPAPKRRQDLPGSPANPTDPTDRPPPRTPRRADSWPTTTNHPQSPLPTIARHPRSPQPRPRHSHPTGCYCRPTRRERVRRLPASVAGRRAGPWWKIRRRSASRPEHAPAGPDDAATARMPRAGRR